MPPLVQVRNLSATISTGTGRHHIVDDVSFSIDEGEVLAIVGESGSGKTTLCRSLTKLFPLSSRMAISGTVQIGITNLLACNETELQEVRQRAIRYILQEPQQGLNPVMTIRTHMKFATGPMTQGSQEEILHAVGLARDVLDSYPHQLSVGMAQRVMIAMALFPKPVFLIADEPTSAVDASLRYQLFNLLRSIQQQYRMAMIMVTHDLDVARKYADHIAVLLEGRIVETAACNQFFQAPEHPYSRSLLNAIPSLARDANRFRRR